MSSHAPLLVELFTEELPPKSLKALGLSFQETLVSFLQGKGLVASGSASERSSGFATPRRLAVRIDSVATVGAERQVEVKGPSTKVGLDAEGKPTQALIKWAEKQGASVAQLTHGNDGKQDCFYFKSTLPGEHLGAVIQAGIEQTLSKLPIPKFMSYQLADGVTTVTFVRPAHRLLVLHGSTILPCKILGLEASNITQGHRFLANQSYTINATEHYEAQLASAKVVASFEQRKAQIRQALLSESKKLSLRLSSDPTTSDDDALNTSLDGYVDEVCSLVEWPVPYVGSFEEHFLAVPQECLILTMRTNQKYFPLFDAQGKLSAKFLIISNMEVEQPTNIVYGNQRVVRPRLADAQFFFEQDKKQSLASRLPGLASVVYHAKLGTQEQRMHRVLSLAKHLAQACGANADHAQRAAQLAKTDLLTGMVGEFPELQGTMGRYYAQHDGEPEAVCQAIAEHYQPRFAGDALPASSTGLALALADKLETLTGIWGIGMLPTGDRDPFALRRHALGVIRMLLERKLPVSLRQCIQWGFDGLSGNPAVKPDPAGLMQFISERLKGYLRDLGYEANTIEAVLAVDSSELANLISRLDAVKAFNLLPEAQALAAANKRTGNILRKQASEVQALSGDVQASLLQDPAEKALFNALQVVKAKSAPLVSSGAYAESLANLASLRAPVDQFFTDVMVMAEDPAVRANRLRLLVALSKEMNQVAEISLLAA